MGRVTMEFEYRTIKQLATQVNHHWMIFVGKHVFVLSYSALLHVLIIFVTGMRKISVSRCLPRRTIYVYHHSLLANLVTTAGLDM